MLPPWEQSVLYAIDPQFVKKKMPGRLVMLLCVESITEMEKRLKWKSSVSVRRLCVKMSAKWVCVIAKCWICVSLQTRSQIWLKQHHLHFPSFWNVHFNVFFFLYMYCLCGGLGEIECAKNNAGKKKSLWINLEWLEICYLLIGLWLCKRFF